MIPAIHAQSAGDQMTSSAGWSLRVLAAQG